MALTHSCFVVSIFLQFMVIALALYGGNGYEPTPNSQRPMPDKDNLLSTLIGVQGLVYCRSGSNTLPLEGAVTRLTCLAEDEYGYETAPFSILSGASDARGFFFATLSPYEVQHSWKIKECKVFLELSPLEDCQAQTNDNYGVEGAPLDSYRFLPEKKMKLFTVGPFYYTSKPKPVSNGY